MEYRNPRYTVDDMIDCEINHPELGWIPFTCNPNDTGAHFDTAALYNEMKDDPSILRYVPPPPPVPQVITRRQCAMQLFAMKMISGEEAIAMTQSGVPPVSVMEYLNTLPEPQRTMSIMDFAADSYYRDNPLLAQIATTNNMSSPDLDQFFIAAAAF